MKIPPNGLRITGVRFTGASSDDAERGLLGFVSCILNGVLRLDGLAVRRTVDGRLALTFPSRRDGAGRRHYYFRPRDDRARREIEFQVFRALGLTEACTR